MLFDREKAPNDSVIPLVPATVVIENDASENGYAPRMPVPVPDNV
jgi:hypothetical protein